MKRKVAQLVAPHRFEIVEEDIPAMGEKELLVRITNPYAVEPVADKEGNLVTTKPDKRKHGIGLASIIEALPDEIGHIQIKCADNVFKFMLIFSNVI